MILSRKVSHYIITWYLPSGMIVMVSWISFLIPPDVVPGRMALLITVLLVLVNIFNTISTNMPKAERLTAIETYIIACIFFVFAALIGEQKVNKLTIIKYSRVCWYFDSNIPEAITWEPNSNKSSL